MPRTVSISTLHLRVDGSPGFQVPIRPRLPAPPAGERWVGPCKPETTGPIEPFVITKLNEDGRHEVIRSDAHYAVGEVYRFDLDHDCRAIALDEGVFAWFWVSLSDPFATISPGDEIACFDSGSLAFRPCLREGQPCTDSGRRCVRTFEGWFVAVPADRPSVLAAQIAEGCKGAREVSATHERPIRDRFGAEGYRHVEWVGEGVSVRVIELVGWPDPEEDRRSVTVVTSGMRRGPALSEALDRLGFDSSRPFDLVSFDGRAS
jgi:hypothetical protein